MDKTLTALDQNRLLFAHVGHCLLQWAVVEKCLARLMYFAMNKNTAVAECIWSRVRSFETKLDIVNDLMKSQFTNEDRVQDWQLVQKHTRTLYSLRNKIAHATLHADKDGYPFLEPFSKHSGHPDSLIRLDDLKKFTQLFSELVGAFNDLISELQVGSRDSREGDELLARLRSIDKNHRQSQQLKAVAWREYLERNPKENGTLDELN